MKINDFFSKKDIFLNKNTSLYLCGPTVYNSPHIGNMRPIIIFDIINRVLSLEHNVKFAHNITDVDDKIIKKSKIENIEEKEISIRYEKEYLDLLNDLNILTPTYMPRVTDNINGIILFIEKLIKKGNAYERNASVYFDVKSFPAYSENFNIEGIKIIGENKDKKNQKDFVLWKKTDEGIKWKSPWGEGRPGWHTECAFFVSDIFGDNGIELHGGGIDLKFPHHINEMAQYKAITGNEMAKAWLYIGHLNLDKEKMSKSEGNYIVAKDFINKYSSNILRSIMILTNVQKPIDFNENVSNNAEKFINKIENSIKKALISMAIQNYSDLLEVEPSKKFVSPLIDNLNFGEAIKFLLKQVKDLNGNIEIYRKAEILQEIIANLSLVGIKFNIQYNSIRNKIRESNEKKDFQMLDKLREEIIT